MKFDDYEKKHFRLYSDFATTVANILARSIEAASLPAPQSIQARAKDPERLKARLVQDGGPGLDCEVEKERRDLAGARIIFYTNNDVDDFKLSGLIFDNFEVEKDSTKLHYPTKENQDAPYNALHFTVRLKPDRAALPEYAKFADLRCEIQVHTILNHAWSETSHDILYKPATSAGFGKKEMERLRKRMNAVMSRHLMRAGYEIQRVQRDYRRLQQGKELFDTDAIQTLLNAADNNERFDLLTTLKDETLANYDDIQGIYEELREPLIQVARKARETETKPIDTAFGELHGHSGRDVVKLIVDIFSFIRFVDLRGTLSALMTLYRDETDADIRKHILDVAERLATFTIKNFQDYGAGIQAELVTYLGEMPETEIDVALAVARVVCEEALSSGMRDTTWSANSVVLSSGVVQVHDLLVQVRNQALDILEAAFDRAQDDETRSRLVSAMDAATKLPSQARYSNELLAITLRDGARIAQFLLTRLDKFEFESKTRIEGEFLGLYQRAESIRSRNDDAVGCKEEAAALMEAIGKIREALDADHEYSNRKVLVGFRVVLPPSWDEAHYSYANAQNYRNEQAELFVNEITNKNRDEWLGFCERCANTKLTDGATFITFHHFLKTLAKSKPSIAEHFIHAGNATLMRFLYDFLDGLKESGDSERYHRILDEEIASAGRLAELATHWWVAKPNDPGRAARIAALAIEKADDIAVLRLTSFAFSGPEEGAVPPPEQFFRPLMRYLIGKNDGRWAEGISYLNTMPKTIAGLSDADVGLLLEGMLAVRKIDWDEERPLIVVARRSLRTVWDYFGKRIARERAKKEGDRYEAVPFMLHDLEKEMDGDPAMAFEYGRRWYKEDGDWFQFRGGRLIRSVFKDCTDAFAGALARLVRDGDSDDANFALHVLRNYDGRENGPAILPGVELVIKEIVDKYPDDERKLSVAKIVLGNTGVVSGAYGMVEAVRRKKALIEEWLKDPRERVRAFAANRLHELDLRIAQEQQRADTDEVMRNMDFERDGEDGEDNSKPN